MIIDTFLFDLDGTLVDSVLDLATGINLLRGELDLSPLPIAKVRTCVGDGATQLVKRALSEVPFSDALLQRFLTLYGEHLLDATVVYPGIVDFLDAHRHQRLGVVTNKPHAYTLPLLDGLGLASYFEVVIGGDSCSEKKPHPAPIRHALQQLGKSAKSAVMIGDHHTDLQAGAAAGTRTCFCAWGIGHHGDAPYDDLAAAPQDLLHLYPGATR
ncbi:HAD-IA family hydrolase [Trichloromonas sp.]|uniref:HAD-IA family hydrolase n=1 Tax=Trichloromonas sp. TaxID=3069249 RepID=UPI003D817091